MYHSWFFLFCLQCHTFTFRFDRLQHNYLELAWWQLAILTFTFGTPFTMQALSFYSVFNMTPLKHDNCCLPSKKAWTYSCGLCPSVFNTWDEKVTHNLHHFVPCTMCWKTMRSRDHLVEHLKIDHNQTELTRVKHHALHCKTYNLPTIPNPTVKSAGTNPIRKERPTLSTFRR